MSVSTAYLPEVIHASAQPIILDMPDVEALRRYVQDEPDRETLGERVLDALSASAWQTSWQTFGYQWRGEDTLNWGNLDNWIRIKWIGCLIESARKYTCLMQYGVLRDIVRSTRLHRLEEMYSFCDAAAVRDFLQTHPHLIEVILEAYPYLVKHFGPNPQVMLEVVRDPEAERLEQLFAYILTSLDADEALARLDRLDEEWFLDQSDRVGDLFNFNL
jgi:hypothetical protein